jgi:hypothetical protein
MGIEFHPRKLKSDSPPYEGECRFANDKTIATIFLRTQDLPDGVDIEKGFSPNKQFTNDCYWVSGSLKISQDAVTLHSTQKQLPQATSNPSITLTEFTYRNGLAIRIPHNNRLYEGRIFPLKS